MAAVRKAIAVFSTVVTAAKGKLQAVVLLVERVPRLRHQERLKFLQAIEKEAPPEVDVHLILDNYATHKRPKVLRALARGPRFHLHFTPTSTSWRNLVERFFRDLSQDVVLAGSFASAQELTNDIWAT